MRKAIIFALAFLLLLPLARADTYLTSCAVLDTPGETYYLTQDIINSSTTTCMNIAADNVTLDCQGHTIDGNGTSETYGISASSRSNVTVKNCKLTEWWMGIFLTDSHDNIIYSNVIQDNSFYGIYLFYPGSSVLSPNKIYNNLFNNSRNYGMGFSFYVSPNFWNTTRQAGTRIYSAGTEIGGNYWTNSSGTGYSDTCTDSDKDGFCDDPYVLGSVSNSTDYLPLSNQYLPPTTTTTLPPVHGVPLLSNTLVGVVIGFGIITFMLRTLFDIREPKKVIEYFIVLAVIVLTVIALIALFA